MIKNKESVLQKQILDMLKIEGYSAWKMPLGAMMVRSGSRLVYAKNPLKGFPDIFGICKYHKGRMFAIEVKIEGGKVKPEQKEWHELLVALGCICFVARDLETVRTELINVDKFKYENI